MMTGQPIYSTLADDPDLGELVSIFVDEIPAKIAAFTAAWDAGDRDLLRRAAHQMKGAAGSYGFHQVTPVAAKLEKVAASDCTTEEIEETLLQLTEMCHNLRAGTPNCASSPVTE